MARKQKGKTKRTDNDFYPTPQKLTDAVCQRLSHLLDPKQFDVIVEPSAGSGNFVQSAKAAWPEHPIYAIDIRGEERDSCIQKGAASFTVGDWPLIAAGWKPTFRTLVVGNPPYSQAFEHIKAFLDSMAPGSVLAFLLKMNFIGGKGRAENLWPLGQLQYLIPISGRPSFKKTELASNDTNEYGVYVWRKGWVSPPVIEFPHIVWK